jgi:integrase
MSRKRRRGRGEGAVFFSGAKGVWIARAVVGVKPSGSPQYKEVTGRTKDAALAKMKKAEEDARAGRLTVGREATVGAYLDHWLDNVAKPSVGETTWVSYERCVRLHLKPRVGGVKLSQLRPQHVEKLFADMIAAGMSRGNAKKVSEVLSTALEQAARVGMIPSSPAAPVAKPKPPETEIVPFTLDEVKAIRAAAKGNRLEGLFALAVGSGMREGELLGLAWEHIDFDAATVRVERALAVVKGGFRVKEPKSKRGRRVIDLPRFAVDALQEHRKRMLSEGNVAAPVVFCTKTGNYIGKSNFIKQVYHPLLRRAGVARRKFHTFRHTHVSELLARGESVVDVARRIGDRPEVVLKTYAHFLPGAGGKIARRLDEVYGEAAPNRQGGDKVETG